MRRWQDIPNNETYNEDEITQRIENELAAWKFTEGHIQREYKTNGWKSSLMLSNTIGHLAEVAWHHPDIHLSWGSVKVKLMTHSAGGITNKDFELALKIEETILWLPGITEGSALEGTPDDDLYRYIKY